MSDYIYQCERGATTITVYRDFVRFSEAGRIKSEFGACHVRPSRDPKYSAELVSADAMPKIRLRKTSKNARLLSAISSMVPIPCGHMQKTMNGCGAAVADIVLGRKSHLPIDKIVYTKDFSSTTKTHRIDVRGKSLASALAPGVRAILLREHGLRIGHYVAVSFSGKIIDPLLVKSYTAEDYPRKNWEPIMAFSAD